MGSKAGTILPLVAIAVASVFTMGGAAVAAGAGAAAAGAGAGLAGGAGLGALSSAGLGGALAGTLTTATSAAAATGAATAGGLFGLGLGAKEVIGLGMSAASSLMKGMAASSEAQAQQNALKLQSASDSLELAEREKEAQNRLRDTLANQNVWYAATGMDMGSGSPQAAASSAEAQANREMSIVGAHGQISAQGNQMQRRMAARRKAMAMPGALIDFGTQAYGALA